MAVMRISAALRSSEPVGSDDAILVAFDTGTAELYERLLDR